MLSFELKLAEIKKDFPLEFNELLKRQSFQAISKWEGGSDETKYIFELDEKIYLGLYYQGTPINTKVAQKEFKEGLWNFDVVEAFISLDNTRYLEINLSANGAWWAATFSDTRKREKDLPKIKVGNVVTYSKDNHNLVIASFSYEDLSFSNEFNINAIVSKRHYTLNPPATTKPDFHLPQLRIRKSN